MATKLRVTEDTPSPTKNIVNDKMDARDILTMMAGGGHTSLADPEIKKHYGRLTNIVGNPMAQKLANQVFLYNQRPEVQAMAPEQRVGGFFSLGSNDPSVNAYMKEAGGLGYGVMDGFRNSPLVGNRLLNNKDVSSGQNPDTQKIDKIKLLVKNNIK